MGRTTPFFELEAALGAGGCPICALTARALERYFSGMVYESVNDTSLRATLRQAHGLCAAHGATLRAMRSALGTAIIQRDVLRAVARALAGAPDAGGGWRAALLIARGSPAADALAPATPCPACGFADTTAAEWLGVLLQHYPALRPAFQPSAGLCVAHLGEALGRAAPAEAAALREDQLVIWARLEAELDEFIRKQDHNFAHEPSGAESDAWARATDLLAGDARVAGSRRRRRG